LEIGRYELASAQSSPGFLTIGVMNAYLNLEGKCPVVRERSWRRPSRTVRPERRGATCVRVMVPWSHQANLITSPRIACTTASTVQDRCPGL